jgi:subtilisin family serine protease
MKWTRFAPAVAAGALALAACADRETTAPVTGGPELSVSGAAGKSYVILGAGNALPTDLAAAVAAAGGTLTGSLPQIGIAFATSADAAFEANASNITGVLGVAEDLLVQWVDPNAPTTEVPLDASEPVEEGHAVGGHERFRLMQWAPDAVNAPAAWAAGEQGAGARVAIVDGAIYNIHPELAPNVDVARSASFVPGQPFNNDLGTFWHGTHVAGIVGAVENGAGIIGIAPRATLIGVKVLHGGSGQFSWVINGIVYAATPISEGGAGADIINMSLGATIPRTGMFGPGLPLLFNAVSRATSYAYQRGVTVVAAAGNSAIDIDHTANLFFIPAQSTDVIGVAATGPTGFALGASNFDRPASYTNFGQSAIDFAAGGGDFVLPGSALCSMPRLPQPGAGFTTFPCWVFDMVVSPCRGSAPPPSFFVCWAAGTSMASPVVTGVAALIVGKHGPMHPAQVEAMLRQSADDLGKPGNDDFYGLGRVNAWRAVQ